MRKQTYKSFCGRKIITNVELANRQGDKIPAHSECTITKMHAKGATIQHHCSHCGSWVKITDVEPEYFTVIPDAQG